MDDGYVRVPNDPEFRKLLEVIFDDKFMKENTTLENFEAFKYSVILSIYFLSTL